MDIDPDRLARLSARLALPEREPDEAFVGRVGLALEAKALEQQAKRARREELVVNILAGAALLAGLGQFADIGAEAAPLLAPLAGGMSGAALLWGIVWLALTGLSGEREGLVE